MHSGMKLTAIFNRGSIPIILLAVVSVILVIDVTMVRALLSIGPRYSIMTSIFVFITIFVLFLLSSTIIITSIQSMFGKTISLLANKRRIIVRYLPIIAILVNASFIIAIIFEMVVSSKYQSALLSLLITPA